MFSELPKLFERNFAVAYFLPVSLFLLASARLLYVFGYWSTVNDTLMTDNRIFDATVILFGAWILSILLLVLNGGIYRFLEGYGKYNPLTLFKRRALKDFEDKQTELDALDKNYSNLEPYEIQRRNELMEVMGKYYPDQERHILPTAFGNTLRAFEAYPRVMYGLEGIDGWPRLLAVVPKDFRELIDDAKAEVDWWINLTILSFILLIEFWLLAYMKWKFSLGWLYTTGNILVPLGLFLLLSWFLLGRAREAAVGWGDYVKSAFDVYRFKLLESLGIDLPKGREEEKELWTNYSQAILFRLPERLPDLKKPENKPPMKKVNFMLRLLSIVFGRTENKPPMKKANR